MEGLSGLDMIKVLCHIKKIIKREIYSFTSVSDGFKSKILNYVFLFNNLLVGL